MSLVLAQRLHDVRTATTFLVIFFNILVFKLRVGTRNDSRVTIVI